MYVNVLKFLLFWVVDTGEVDNHVFLPVVCIMNNSCFDTCHALAVWVAKKSLTQWCELEVGEKNDTS